MDTMDYHELLLNENFLALHRPQKPVPYPSEEEASLPLAAE